MPRTDWFNEAMITAMLAACAKDAGTGARVAQGAAVTEAVPFMPPAGRQGTPNAQSPVGTDAGLFMPSAGGQGTRDAQGAASDDAVTLMQASNLRAHLLSLLDEARRLAVADGFPPEYAETADFAVCAFIDETLLSSGWTGRAEWMARSLQLERHDTGTAGEDFYRLLDDLLEKAGNGSAPDLPAAGAASPSATGGRERSAADRALENLLEIFALCLAQGFTGMYFNDPDTVRSYLRKIGERIPSVGASRPQMDNALSFPVAGAPRAPSSLLLRFDLLDWMLWLAPLGITAAIHHLCGSRLDGMLTGLLQRSTLP